MTKQTRMTNDRKTSGTSSFGFRASSFLRHSSFVLRHSLSSFSTGYHKYILQVGQIHRRRYSCLAVQLAHLETLDRADQQPRRENTTNAGGVDLGARTQVRLL